MNPSSSSRPLLLGHRGVRPLPYLGLRWRKPSLPVENSLAAFDYALAHGCDGFEFDVRFTRDRRSVLCHDPQIKRQVIADTEYSGLERRRGYNLARFEDVLTRFGETSYLDIELKIAGDEELIVTLVQAHPPQRGYVVSSFLPEVLLRLNALNATLPLGYVCEDPRNVGVRRDLPLHVFIPHYSLVTQDLVDDAHAAGVQVFAWTVNQQADLLLLASWGVDGLISDDPRLLARTFANGILK